MLLFYGLFTLLLGAHNLQSALLDCILQLLAARVLVHWGMLLLLLVVDFRFLFIFKQVRKKVVTDVDLILKRVRGQFGELRLLPLTLLLVFELLPLSLLGLVLLITLFALRKHTVSLLLLLLAFDIKSCLALFTFEYSYFLLLNPLDVTEQLLLDFKFHHLLVEVLFERVFLADEEPNAGVLVVKLLPLHIDLAIEHGLIVVEDLPFLLNGINDGFDLLDHLVQVRQLNSSVLLFHLLGLYFLSQQSNIVEDRLGLFDLLNLLDDHEFGLPTKGFSLLASLQGFDSFSQLCDVVVDRMRLLAQLLALNVDVLDLALEVFNFSKHRNFLVRVDLQLLELLIQLLLDRITGLLSVNHIVAILLQASLDLPDFSI